MQIQISEVELTAALAKHLPDEVTGISAQIAPDGVRVYGTYKKAVNINWKTLWFLSADQGQLVAELASFRAAGLPMFKSLLMSHLKDLANVSVEGDKLRLDVGQYGEINAVTTSPGALILFVTPVLKEEA